MTRSTTACGAVKKMGQAPLARQEVNEQNGLPLRARGLTRFFHSPCGRGYILPPLRGSNIGRRGGRADQANATLPVVIEN